MKTNVIIKRQFYQTEVDQRTKDGFFNATALLKYYNLNNDKQKVVSEFWANKSTQDYMEALADDINVNMGKSLYLPKDLYSSARGKNGGTYMHPYLFMKFAMWLSPQFEVQIIKWVYDNLIDFRNKAGDHYKEMCSVIKDKYVEYYKNTPDPMVFQKEARYLNQLVFGDSRDRGRNEATEQELDLLNKLQVANIKLLQKNLSKDERHKKLRDFAELSTITT